MAFNLNPLIDFLVTRYEEYMKKRLIDFVNGRMSKSLLYKMHPVNNGIPRENIKLIDYENLLYSIKRESSEGKEYVIDILNGMCTCLTGLSGNICKHASAVMVEIIDKINTSYNLVGPSVKKTIFLVATGKEMASDWLIPLNEQPLAEREKEQTTQI